METMDLIRWNGIHIVTATWAEFANAKCFSCARSMQLLYLFRKKFKHKQVESKVNLDFSFTATKLC